MINSQNKTENISCDITLLPFYVTYPFVYPEFRSLFAHSAKIDIKSVLHSYSIHFFGLLSSEMVIDSDVPIKKFVDQSIIDFLNNIRSISIDQIDQA